MKSFIIWFMFSLLDSADSCSQGGYGNFQPQFGPKCMYRCHCVDDVQCDIITGNCTNGCAAGWMGPGCQYGDIAYNKQVKHLLYDINLFIDGRNATDGLPTTCVGPTTWVEIDLNATYKISGLVMNSSDTMNLTGYEVRVGNYSSDPSLDIVHTCIKQNITHELVTSTDVVCKTEIVGRYLLIRTPDNAATTLCDVRVYGGRSLAYGRNGHQSSTSGTNAIAARALDGNNNTDFWALSCTHTRDEMSQWWSVNLVVVYNIARIVLFGRSDCCTERLSGFSVSFATNSSFNLVFKYPEKTPPLMTEVITLSENYAQHVEISLKDIKQTLTLYEVFVFGACPLGWYGINCSNKCGRCANRTCDHINGTCHFGCSEGYSGTMCTETCSLGTYGVNCSNICGHCANITCDHIDGTCPVGCSEGYNGARCSERQEETSTGSSSTLPIGITVGVALGAVGLTIMAILFAIIYWKRSELALETSEIDHTYDQIDTARALREKLSDYSKIEELGLSPGTGRADDCIETLNKSYHFEAKGRKEFTILSDFPTTSEAIWRLALEHRIHLIIIIGENRIPLKPKVQIDIGLIQIECIDLIVERDLLLCNINVSKCEKDTKMRNIQVILCAEECSFCIPSNINETLAVLKKRLWLRQGIEAFNTLINCTPDATDGECFVASLLMTDFMERSGYIDIIGIIEAMRKEKHDAINSFDKFKFCHDVIFKWIVDEENKRRMGELTLISSVA